MNQPETQGFSTAGWVNLPGRPEPLDPAHPWFVVAEPVLLGAWELHVEQGIDGYGHRYSVNCLVDAELWPEEAAQLEPYVGTVGTLHLPGIVTEATLIYLQNERRRAPGERRHFKASAEFLAFWPPRLGETS